MALLYGQQKPPRITRSHEHEAMARELVKAGLASSDILDHRTRPRDNPGAPTDGSRTTTENGDH